MGANNTNSERLRVLIADDNKEMRETVARLLRPGFDVVGAVGDGRSLVRAESELEPDVGIIDISMPIMNGIEATLEIKRRGSDVKIVFLTVNEDTDFVKAALATGATAYVIKRQMVSDLVLAIEAACEGRRYISSGCVLLNEDGSEDRSGD